MNSILSCSRNRWKRFFRAGSAILLMAFSGNEAQAQLSGIYSIPTDFPTLATAITALNTQGVSGPVIINLPAGYTETAPVGGFVLDATGTSTQPIVFQKNGSGANPLLTAYTGTATASSVVRDGIWSLNGSDYITIDGIDMVDNNTSSPATMEYGIALYKTSSADGCQNNTIQNCTIKLNPTNTTITANGAGSVGILVLNAVRNSSTFLSSTLPMSSSSNNKFYNNTIQNCNQGIVLVGYTQGLILPYDTGNDIGGSSAATGNHILNFGGYTSGGVSESMGVSATGQHNLNVSNNVIDNNDGTGMDHPSYVYGISLSGAYHANATVNSNTISVHGSGAATQIMGIKNTSGAAGGRNTIVMNNNLITNCSAATASYPSFYGIYNNANCSVVHINNNTFSSNSANVSGTGVFHSIYNAGNADSLVSITENTISMGVLTSSVNTGVTYSAIYNSAASLWATVNISNNTLKEAGISGNGKFSYYNSAIYNSSDANIVTIQNNSFENLSIKSEQDYTLIYNNANAGSHPSINISNNSIPDAFSKTLGGGTVYGIYNGGSPNSGSFQVSNNNFSFVTLSGNTSFIGIYHNDIKEQGSISGNTINNIITDNGSILGIVAGSQFYLSSISTVTPVTTCTVSNNTVSDIYGGKVTGIAAARGVSFTVHHNTILNLVSNGTGTLYGLALGGSSVGTTAYKNKIGILNASDDSCTVVGCYVGSGVNTIVYNNLIGNLSAPLSWEPNQVSGFYLDAGKAALYYNSVHLASYSVMMYDYQSSAVYMASASSDITLKNNIFVNKCTVSTPGGLTVALRRNGSSLSPFNLSSNNNIYYAGIPDSTHLIYYDGTNKLRTLADFKAWVTPREMNAAWENPPFASTSDASPNFLSFSQGATTVAESGATAVSGISDDFYGTIRQGNAGYTGTGSAPDIGATEFNGINNPVTINSVAAAPSAAVLCAATSRTISALITPGTTAITTAILSYSVNGVTQTDIAMSGGNPNAASTWTANIPIPSLHTATIAWKVTASDASTSRSASGTNYADEPLTGISAAVVDPHIDSICPSSMIELQGRGYKTFAPVTVSTGTPYVGAYYLPGMSPFYHLNGGQKAQYIFTASELIASGLSAGNINSISCQLTSVGTPTLNGFSISMSTTSLSSFYGITSLPSATQDVYSVPTLTLVTGLNTFTFSSPFQWDGVSNIIVQMCYSNANSGGTNSSLKVNQLSTYVGVGIAANYQPPYAMCNATTPGNVNGSISIAFYRPVLTFSSDVDYNFTAASWTDGNMIVSTTNPATVVPVSSTAYTVTLTDANGCSMNAISPTIKVHVPLAAPSVTNSIQCGLHVPGVKVNGNVASIYDYFWYPSATSQDLLFDGTDVYNGLIDTTTTFYVSCYDHFCFSPRSAVTASVTPANPITIAVSNASLCTNGSTTLSASSTGTTNYSYTWSGNADSGIGGNASGSSITVSPTAYGQMTYTVIGSDSTCAAFATSTIMMSRTLDAEVSATPITLCSGATLSLTASAIPTNSVSGTPGGAESAIYSLAHSPYRSGADDDYRTQWLFTATELNAVGVVAGNINALSFNVDMLGIGTMNNFTIRMRSTNSTSLSTTFDTSAATIVYGPTAYTAVSGINKHNFSTAFFWDGVSNIIVEVCHDAVTIFGHLSSTVHTEDIYDHGLYATQPGACNVSTGLPAYGRPKISFYGHIVADTDNSFNWTWNQGTLSGATTSVTVVNSGTSAIVQSYTATYVDPHTTCSNSASVTVTITPGPAAPNAVSALQCGAGVPTVSVSGAASAADYHWYSDPVGGNLLQSGGSTYTASIAGTDTFYVSINNTTCMGQRAMVIATVIPADTLNSNVSASTVCYGTGIDLWSTLTGSNSNSSYTWMATPSSGSGIPSGISGDSIHVTPTLPGTYIYNVTAVYGNCVSTSTVSVIVSALPTVTLSASDSTLCLGDNALLTASGAQTYTWIPANTNGSTTTVSPNTATTYTVIGSDANNCSDTTTINIQVNPLPTLTLSASDSTICLGDSTILSVSGANSYTWTPAVITGTTGTVFPGATTVYTVTGTDSNGCVGSDTLSIFVNSLVNVSAQMLGGNLNKNSTVETSGGTTWNLNGDPIHALYTNPTSSGTYTLTSFNLSCLNSNRLILAGNPTTGIDETIHEAGIQLYPNPSNGLVTLAFETLQGTTHFNLFDTEGKMIFQHAVNALVTQLDLSSLASGVYYAEISSNKVLLQRTKLVIIR